MGKLLGNVDTGSFFVISGPAGVGKSTLVNRLIAEFPDAVVESCSCTTRKPRPGEVAQHHYEFISDEEFFEKVRNDEFLEHAHVFGNNYGTTKKDVNDKQASGKHVILVIDVQGAASIKDKIDATFIFIHPPTIEELKRRLRGRKTEDEEMFKKRTEWAEKELKMAHIYDYHIVNDDIETSYQILRSIIVASESKRRKHVI